MTAEAYGAQIILLLHRIALAVEPYVIDPSAADHGFVAGGQRIEAVVGVITALVHPGVIALSGEFVLELNMVKFLVIDIKSVNHNGHIPSYRILRRQGVLHPAVVRSRQVDGAADGQIVDRECGSRIDLRVAGRLELYGYILVVVSLAGIHLHGFVDNHSGVDLYVPSITCERHAVHIDLSTMRIAGFVEFELEGYTRRAQCLLHFVGQLEVEPCGLVVRYIASLMHIDVQFGVLEPQRAR